jgi:hypothetical protein
MTAETAEQPAPEPPSEAGFRFPRWLWLCYALMLAAIAGVGATSFWMEAGRESSAAPLWPLAIDEATSVATVFALTPLLLRWAFRLDPRRIGWGLVFLGHAAGAIAFSLLHIAGMLLARFALYPLFGGAYRLGGEPFLTRLLYEGRKDSLTYIGLIVGAWLLRTVLDKKSHPVPAPSPRLEIRDGAKRYWLATNDILWAEAAGNYVELHLADRSLLRRQTLTALESELADRNFVRIHRSRLVNAKHVTATETNDSGDFTVTLTDGRQISGGRRWRSGLDAVAKS